MTAIKKINTTKSKYMSIFNTFFGDSGKQKSEQGSMKWISLENLSQLDEIEALSNNMPVVIFKHSTRCSISRMALKQFEEEFDSEDKVSAYFLDLILHRDVSNEIASRFKVVHQSPQLLLIKDGSSIYNVSHDSIDATDLKNKLE